MASTTHLATPEDDARHTPGPGSLPLWNESLWFPFYDPKSEVGVVLRAGIHPNLREANLFLFLTHRGTVVHSLIDHRSSASGSATGTGCMRWTSSGRA